MPAKSVRKVSERQESAAKKFSKNDPRYWEQVVYLPTKSKTDGEDYEGKIFLVKIQHQKRRKEFSTDESSRRSAGKKALTIYHSLKANGWEITLNQFGNTCPVSSEITIGEFIAIIEKRSGIVPKTLNTYATKFRTIAGEAFGMSNHRSKYDIEHGGRGAWRKKVESIPLAKLTPEIVQEWKLKKLRKCALDPIALSKTPPHDQFSDPKF